MNKQEEALAALRRAMENEREGYRFYLEAAERSADPAGQGTFRTLASDEEKHLALLLVEHNSLIAGEGWVDPEEAITREVEMDITKPLFPGEELALQEKSPFEATWAAYEVEELAGDLAVLKFGMEVEEKFYKMYEKAAAETDDPLGHRAYQFLMKEENRHYKLLQDAHDYLSDNKHWWDDWELPFFEG
ncbi:MAG: ferritin family protein [Anaerolineae bacterium]